jgi:outer membrane protein TolC
MKAWDKAEGAIKDRPPAPLEEFEKLACEHNPTLVQARAQAEGAFGQAVQAGLWPNPRFFYIQDQINQKGTPGEFQGAAVQQEIVTADKRKLSRAKFLEQTKAAEWQALAQEYMVLNDVRAHYFRTLGKQELVRVGYELLKNMEDRLVTLREMYNLGQATRDELHTANANLQDARLALLDLQNDYLQAWETLTALAGVDMPPRPLAGGLEEGLPPIEWDAALARLLAESPEVRRTEAHLRADVIGLKREKVESIPNVFVRAGSGYNFPDQRPVGTVTVFFDVPVIDWNQGNVRTARSHVDRQAAEVRRVELDLRRRLAAVYRVYLSALQHVKEYRETVLPEARKAYEVMLDQYKADRVKWVDVLAVEQAYFARRATYIANLVAWRESEVLIVGYLLAGGLTPAAAPLPVPAAGPAGGSAGPGLIGNPPGLPGDQGNQGGAVGGGQGPMRRNQR